MNDLSDRELLEALGVEIEIETPSAHSARQERIIAGFEEIRTSARTVMNGGEKILSRARLMEEEITKRLIGLDTQLGRLRAVTVENAA